MNLLDEGVVDVVTCVAGVHLVAGAWDGAVDAAQVSGSGPDVNDEGVGDHVERIGHSKRFRDDHGGVDRSGSSVKDGGLVDVAGLSGRTDHGHDTVVFLRVRKANEMGDEVSDELSVLGRVLDDTELKRAVEVQSQAVLQGLVAKKDVSLQEVPSDRVLGCSNDRQFFHFMAVGGDHHRTEGSQVNSNIQHVFCHRRNRLSDTASLYEECPHS